MSIRWAELKNITISVLALLSISTLVNAGTFKDFILDEALPDASQSSVQLPANSQSASCMQCHDGSRAKSVSIKHADTAMAFTSHGSSNHPVGMYYASYVQRSPASYVAAARLDSRIKLENGQVTCISCHQTKSHNIEVTMLEENKPVIEKCSSTKVLTTGSNQTHLCMSCHAM
jgi:hypothetical protein